MHCIQNSILIIDTFNLQTKIIANKHECHLLHCVIVNRLKLSVLEIQYLHSEKRFYSNVWAPTCLATHTLCHPHVLSLKHLKCHPYVLSPKHFTTHTPCHPNTLSPTRLVTQTRCHPHPLSPKHLVTHTSHLELCSNALLIIWHPNTQASYTVVYFFVTYR